MVIGIDGSVLRIRSEERERKRRSAVLVFFFWVDVVVVGRVMLQCLLLYIEEAIFQWLPERVECCICFCLRFSSFFLSFLGFRGMIFSIVIQQEFRSSVMVLKPKVDQVGSSCISSHSSFFVFL
jgi:hypothetical protein